jgi:methionine-rich copper-binding protein CopC
MSAYRRARAPAAVALAAGLVALLLGTLWPPGTAHAAAQPRKVSSDPSAGETRHHAPDRVRITFDEPLDDSSEIKVTDRCDRRLDDGNTRVNLNEMSVGIVRKPSGTYHVSYKATGVGGATGTRFASFQFEVHMGPSCDGGPPQHRHASGDGTDLDDEHSRLHRLTTPTSIDRTVGDDPDGSELVDLLADAKPGPEALTQARAEDEMVVGLLDVLEPRARFAVEQRFGLNDGRSRSYREVGEELGVTAEAARRLVKRAVGTVREEAATQGAA